VQLQLQKSFPLNALQMERPFPLISRIADLCWEKEKIVFEIQCSPLNESEAKARMRDYQSQGYAVVWLLDDKRYNKRLLRPSEDFLRHHSAYYVSIRQGFQSEYYDQFEVFHEGKRVKKGKRLRLDLQKIRRLPNVFFREDLFPQQICHLNSKIYFLKDRLHHALSYPLAMQNWRAHEILLIQTKKTSRSFKSWFRIYITLPYLDFLQKMIRKMN
jgi:competence CoiA-like predicted nuclease